MFSDFLSLLLIILSILNFAFAVIVVFIQRKNPATTWAWLMVIIIIPYVGFLIYLLFGLDGRKHKVFAEKTHKDEWIFNEFYDLDENNLQFLNEQMEYVRRHNIMQTEGSEHFDDMVYLNLISGNGFFYENNDITIYDDGNTKFDALIDDIGRAEKFIHLQYYIVRNDELGKRIITALAKKAEEGVEVRMLIDGMGCVSTHKGLFKPLIKAGGKLSVFLPPYFIRINFRNHRKIAVIDGKIGYVGGLNIGDEYLGVSKRFGFWRDCHIKAVGDAVKQMELRFIMDWNYSAKDDKIKCSKEYFPTIESKGKTGMQIVSSGPDTKWPSILYGYNKMISEADKSIYIQTPYFVPDDSMFEAIRVAALSGIDVRIIIPANPDHPFVYWAALSYLGELLNAGVKCYKYEKGFVHSKFIVVDTLVSSIGTANMDIRSFKLNFETNAFIYGHEIAKRIEDSYFKDLDDCTEITLEWYNNRSAMTKLKEAVSRLLAPLL